MRQENFVQEEAGKSFLCILFFFTPEAKIALNKTGELRKASPYRKGKEFP